ncbi:structural protein [Bivalve hepelivirus G]|uniref:structural protein n=1 Tax=Bivalve hepelivirus G TaxID=1926998 RepID=UPI00092DCC65|nr:structural protein [Bivalve hepelivirus G]APJ38013.1 structural protein [Bivalve hepelivirus G]
MNAAAPLVDNSMNFDPMSDSTSMPEQTHGKTLTPSQAFVCKVTHPPTTVPEFAGLPTQDTRTQVVYNMRNIDVIKTPITFDKTSGKYEQNSWTDHEDYSFIVPTGARIKWFGCCYQVNDSQTTPTTADAYDQDLANVGVQDNFDFKSWSSTVNLYRPCYKSITLYPNVTAFNNQGIISAQQFNPNILFSGSTSALSYDKPKLFMQALDHLYSQINDKLFCNEETHVDFHQTVVESWFKTRKLRVRGLNLDPNNFLQILNIGNVGYGSDTSSLVPTPSQIAQNSMRSYQDKFINGAFVVSRINTLSPKWMAGSNTNIPVNGLYECWLYSIGPDGRPHLVSLKDPVAAGTAAADAKPMLDTLWSSDMTWQFIRVQGISPNVTASTAPAVVSPIAIKHYYGIEAQPVWNGPWNGIARMSPKPSLSEMQALMDTFYEMPDAMPAKYNAMGAFLPFLASALPHALRFVKDLITSKKSKNDGTVGVATTTKRSKASTKPISSNNDKQIIANLRKQIASMQLNNRPPSKRRKTRKPRSKSSPIIINERTK